LRFEAEGDYFDFRAKLLGIEEPRPDVEPGRRAVLAVALAKRRRNEPPVENLAPMKGIAFKLMQRNTPALWGAGLIDAIAESVIRIRRFSKARVADMAGRAQRATGGGVGRFGWRGQTASLRQFVMIACGNELGLQTKDHPQPLNPLTAGYRLSGRDMSDADMDALVRFVQDLSKSLEVMPTIPLTSSALTGANKYSTALAVLCAIRAKWDRSMACSATCSCTTWGRDLATLLSPIRRSKESNKEYSGIRGPARSLLKRDPPRLQQWRTPPLSQVEVFGVRRGHRSFSGACGVWHSRPSRSRDRQLPLFAARIQPIAERFSKNYARRFSGFPLALAPVRKRGFMAEFADWPRSRNSKCWLPTC
jgi:hypothetical protein